MSTYALTLDEHIIETFEAEDKVTAIDTALKLSRQHQSKVDPDASERWIVVSGDGTTSSDPFFWFGSLRANDHGPMFT